MSERNPGHPWTPRGPIHGVAFPALPQTNPKPIQSHPIQANPLQSNLAQSNPIQSSPDGHNSAQHFSTGSTPIEVQSQSSSRSVRSNPIQCLDGVVIRRIPTVFEGEPVAPDSLCRYSAQTHHSCRRACRRLAHSPCTLPTWPCRCLPPNPYPSSGSVHATHSNFGPS